MMLVLKLHELIKLPAFNYFHCTKQVRRINYEHPFNEPGDSLICSNSGELREAQENDYQEQMLSKNNDSVFS